ncbi:MAG: TrmB family transcriptional regulator [Fervidicoccaceae archaeon]|jgi:sugar-specific transcriptional regulator TrmB
MKDEGVKPLDFLSAEIGSLARLLRLMGLGKREIDIYLYLLTHGPSTAREIAKSLNIPYSKAYDSLSKLNQLGWVIKTESRPYRFHPTNVREIWDETKKGIENKMQEVEEKLIPLIEKIASSPSPLFKILLIDESEVLRFFLKMIEFKGKELSLAIAHAELLKDNIPEILNTLWEDRARILLTKDIMESVGTSLKRKRVKLRVINEMFGSGAIGQGIMLIYKNGSRLNGLWSDHAYFVDLGRVYFEYLWNQAKDVE